MTGHGASGSSGRSGHTLTPAQRRITRGIALAMCAGPWTRRSAGDRAARALGARPKWLAGLVSTLFKVHPQRPGDPEAIAESCARLLFPEIVAANDEEVDMGTLVVRARIVRWYAPLVWMTPRWGVPKWATIGTLSAAFRLPSEQLAWLADRRGILARTPRARLRHYRIVWIPKRAGGHRILEAPKGRLKRIQVRILREVLDRVPVHPAATGFVRGLSIVDHASRHCGADVVIRMDLEDFFLTTRSARVVRIFRAAGYPAEVARTLAALTTTATHRSERSAPLKATDVVDARAAGARRLTAARLADRHLPQGAPTSPALANLAARGLDRRLSGLARAAGVAYSRYADDIVFSGWISPSSVRSLTTMVAVIASDEGYAVNHRKTRVMRSGGRQEVTGIVVNAHPNVPREAFDGLKAILTNCVRHGPTTQNRDGRTDFRAWLIGSVAWVRCVNPSRGAKLAEILAGIAW